MTTTTTGITGQWQARAAALRARANELGDCRAGLEAFTEATVLEACADETWEARDQVIAILRQRICEQVHAAHGATAKYQRERRFGQAFATGQALEVVLRELGKPGDRTLPKPDGALPLNPRAEIEARAFLGVMADYLLGREPVTAMIGDSRYLNDPETGKPRLLSEQCATCVGRPGNVTGLHPGRLREVVNSNLNGLGLICHETIDYDPDGGEDHGGQQAFCRWFFARFTSNYQRICLRLGGFTEVPPPPDPRVTARPESTR